MEEERRSREETKNMLKMRKEMVPVGKWNIPEYREINKEIDQKREKATAGYRQNNIEANTDMLYLRKNAGRKQIIILRNSDNVEKRNKEDILKVVDILHCVK